MSKLPKSDHTESALNSVEQALKIDFQKGAQPDAEAAAKKVKRMATGTGAPTARQNAAVEAGAEPAQDRGRQQPADRKGQERSRARRAANDDVRSVGNLLYA